MANKIVQKMANEQYIYLTPQKTYLFMGKEFTRLRDCYDYEISLQEQKVSTRDTWVRDMIKKQRGF